MSEVNPDRRSQILEAAFGEFAAKGFKGTTIKSIAAAAGLQSPALIYHYFPDKQALFGDVMRSYAPVLQVVSDLEQLMDLPPEEVLTRLGESYLAFDRTFYPLMQFMIAEVVRSPEAAKLFVEDGPGRVLNFLKHYLEVQVHAGKLRPHDVRSSARAFIGMLLPQVAGNVLFPALASDGLTNEEHLKTVVETFLRGLEPEK